MKRLLSKGIALLLFAFILAGLLQPGRISVCSAATLDTELLVNGGGEASSGWTPAEGTNLSAQFTSTAGGRTGNYWAIYGHGYVGYTEECFQVIDVSNLDFSAGNTLIKLNGYVMCEDQYSPTYPNNMIIKLEQLDGSGILISDYTPWSYPSLCNKTWESFARTETVSVKTKKIRVTLSGYVWGEGGGYLYGGFDDLSLKLTQSGNSAPTFNSLPSDQIMDSGTTSGTLNYSVSDLEEQAMTLTVSSSNTSLVNISNATYSAGTGSFKLTATNGEIGSAEISLIANDGVRETISKFKVTVYPNIQIGSNMVRSYDGTSKAGWVDESSRFNYGTSFTLDKLPDGFPNYFMYQDIDITRFSTYIDTGLAEFTSSCTLNASASYRIEGLDTNGSVAWTKLNGIIPAGTKKLRIYVGGSSFASIDDVNVTITNLSKMTDITNQTIKAGQTVSLPFSVIYPAGASISATSSNTAVVANGSISISNTGYQRTLNLTTVAGAQGTTTITVNVVDLANTTNTPPTNITKTFTVTAYSVPGAPTIVSVSDATYGMSVSFNAPASDGGNSIVEYVVTSNPGSITSRGSTSPITVTGLTVGTIYTFTVQAVNAAGTGTQSSASASRLMTAPPVVDNASASAITAFSANVSSGITSDGSSSVTAKGIEYKKSSDSTYTQVPAGNGTGSFSVNLTGLSLNTTYDIRSYATNARGTAYGSVSSFTTLSNTPPTITSITDPDAINEDAATGNISFTIGDAQSTADSLVVEASSNNTSLVPNDPTNLVLGGSDTARNITIYPAPDKSGTAVITVKVTDNYGESAQATFLVTVNAVNDAPTANAGTLSVTEDTLKSGALTGADIDGDSLTYEAVTQPLKGTLTLNSNGSFSYLPNANVNGTDSFTFKTKDAALYSTQSTITINIAAVNDAPVANAGILNVTEDTLTNGTLSGSDVEGSPLTFILVTGVAHGTVTVNSDGSYTYQPGQDYYGSDTFTFKVYDGAADSSAAAVTITINPVNDAPTVADNTLSVTEDTLKNGTLTGTDVDNDTLTYEAVSQPAKGTLNLKADGSFTYLSNANVTGSDSFTYKAKDAALDSATATITITIAAVNDAPTANAGSLIVTEDTPKAGTLTGSDVESSPLTFVRVTDAAHGTVTVNSDGSYTYQPDQDYNGSDSFTFKANDGAADSSAAAVTITVNPVNDAPVVVDNTLSVTEDTLKLGTLTGTDIDGDSLTYEAATQPVKGTIVLASDGSFTYLPDANVTGIDSFTYKAKDAALSSTAATITFTINAVNDAPVANDGTLIVTEDTLKAGTLTGSDVEGSPLTFVSVTDAAHGTVTVNSDGSYTYQPDQDYNGSDTFTFKANDGAADSSAAAVTITVNPVNDAPVVADNTLSVTEDTLKNGTLTGTDIDNDDLTYEAVTQPSKGTLTLKADGSFTYLPNANVTGSDSFTYKAKDAALYSASSTITITIAAVNDVPVANTGTLNVTEDIQKNGVLTGSDVEHDSLTFEVVTQPNKGTVTVNPNGSYVYQPNANAYGNDSFTFKVKDGSLYSEAAAITITITAVNDAPAANNSSLNVTEDILKNGKLTGTDIDGDSLTFEAVTQPSKGTLVLAADGSYTYQPNLNVNGSDSFTFKAKDGSLYSDAATVTITIAAVNDAPTAIFGDLTVTEDTLKDGTLTGSDVDGDTVTYELDRRPIKGSVTVKSDGSFTYTPAPDETGIDFFTFKTKDASIYSDSSVINITIEAVNDAPEAQNGTLAVTEDTLTNGILTGTDIDGDNLTYEIVTQPSKGLVTIQSDGHYTYQPNADVNGTDSFTFKAKDGTLYSGTATITITIAAVNDAPAGNAVTLNVTEDTSKSGTLTGTDIDGDTLTLEAVTQPSKGTLTLEADGDYTYLPNANATGIDSFTIRVKDASLYSGAATITVNINAVNDAPLAKAGTLAVAEDTTVNGTLTGTDIDGDTLTYELVTQPLKGKVTIKPDGSYIYQPQNDAIGNDSFTFRTKDASLFSEAATITVTIAKINDAPVVSSSVINVTEDTPANDIVSGTDADGDGLTFEIVTQPTKGSITFHSNGSYTYVPKTNLTGSDSFTFKANDGSVNGNIATVTINITAVNDAPEALAYSVSVSGNGELQGSLAGSDIEGSSLKFIKTSDALHGTASLNADGSFTYKPNTGYSGSDSFTFKVNDGSLDSKPAIVAITVANVAIVVSEGDIRATNGNYIIPSETIVNDMRNTVGNDVTVAVQVPATIQDNSQEEKQVNLILEAAILETAKQEDKSMLVTVEDENNKELYTWTFDQEELTSSENEITDVNLSIGVSALTDSTPMEEAGQQDNSAGIVLSFAHEGELPCQAQIRIFVGDQPGATPGASIYLYHVNKDTGKLEVLPNSSEYIVDEFGFVTIHIVHCSDYVILFDQDAVDQVTGLMDQISVTPSKQTLYIGGTTGASTHINIVLPSTLRLVEELGDKTGEIAIGAVTVTYSSSNTKVAAVDEKGMVTAAGTGKAVITSTLTLYDGSTRIVRTTITVKKAYIVIEKSTASMKAGESFTFTVKAYGFDLKAVTWSTTEKAVLRIDKKTGKATAISKGTDYVVAKIGDMKVKIKVVVK